LGLERRVEVAPRPDSTTSTSLRRGGEARDSLPVAGVAW
jgi:hypothetical protein